LLAPGEQTRSALQAGGLQIVAKAGFAQSGNGLSSPGKPQVKGAVGSLTKDESIRSGLPLPRPADFTGMGRRQTQRERNAPLSARL